jgi:hypothetical protein
LHWKGLNVNRTVILKPKTPASTPTSYRIGPLVAQLPN